jgi:cephalosporin hydroxylase
VDHEKAFEAEVVENIQRLRENAAIKQKSLAWVSDITQLRYTYNFRWLGRPVIQLPQDMVALQEIIWTVRPDLIVETGIAHGGSLILSASMLALLDYSDAISAGAVLDPRATKRRVLGIDVDIREHNRAAIEAHPMSHRISMIQGSSIAPDVVSKVIAEAQDKARVLVILDSNHTHEHVLAELEAYAPLVSEGSYCIVFDTVVEDLPGSMFPDRPWGPGDNPKTAVWEYLHRLRDPGRKALDGRQLALQIDYSLEDKLLITVAPDGYLKRMPVD